MKGQVSFVIGCAALIVVVAGMKAISAVAVPFVLALLVVAAVSPLIGALEKRKVPRWASVAIVIAGIALLFVFLGGLVVGTLQSFMGDLPLYEARVAGLWDGLAQRLGPDLVSPDAKELIDPGAAMRWAGVALSTLMGMVSNAFVILLTVVFILAEAGGLSRKLTAAFGEDTHERIDEAAKKIQSYIALKTIISLITGGLVLVLNLVFGLDYVLLWAVLAFVLNFIPTVGSIAAGAPAVLLALVQLGVGPAIGVAVGYVAINVVVGNIVEPRVMGGQLGLSPLVIFMSLLVWNYIWGPAGMLLCVPLMVALKIALEAHPETERVAILLGSAKAVPST